MRLRFALVISAFVLTACKAPLSPLPFGAVGYSPNPDDVERWWSQVEHCSGITGDLSAVRFYIMPNSLTFTWEGQEVIGLWIERGNKIVLASAFAFREQNVRHEMLHALLRVEGHPIEYFVEKCGHLVDYNPGALHDHGPVR